MDVVEQGYGPGDWPVSYSACEDLKEYLDEAGRPEQQDTFEAMATQLLWEWTGRRFGTDIVSLRPEPLAGHQQPTYRGTSYLRSTFAPVRLGGALHDVVCGLCGPYCTHTAGRSCCPATSTACTRSASTVECSRRTPTACTTAPPSS